MQPEQFVPSRPNAIQLTFLVRYARKNMRALHRENYDAVIGEQQSRIQAVAQAYGIKEVDAMTTLIHRDMANGNSDTSLLLAAFGELLEATPNA
jgi:hypothetical protein